MRFIIILITVQQSMQIIMHGCITLYVVIYIITKVIKGWRIIYKKGEVLQILITGKKENLKELILVGN